MNYTVSTIRLPNGDTATVKDATARSTLSTKAPISSPTFTGTPSAPTATAGTNNTQLATTAFVMNAVTPTNVYYDNGTVVIQGLFGSGSMQDEIDVLADDIEDIQEDFLTGKVVAARFSVADVFPEESTYDINDFPINSVVDIPTNKVENILHGPAQFFSGYEVLTLNSRYPSYTGCFQIAIDFSKKMAYRIRTTEWTDWTYIGNATEKKVWHCAKSGGDYSDPAFGLKYLDQRFYMHNKYYDCTIEIGPGEYNLFNITSYVNNGEIFKSGLFIPPYVKIKGAGKDKTKLVYHYNGVNGTYSTSFMYYVSGLNMPYESSLEDLTLEVKNVRYAIHSDGGMGTYVDATTGSTVTVTNNDELINNNTITLKNVRLIHLGFDDGLNPTDPETGDIYKTPACWGSGSWNNANQVFINCDFISYQNTPWFNHNRDSLTEKSTFYFENCTFNNALETNPQMNLTYAGIGFISWGSGVVNDVILKNCYANHALCLYPRGQSGCDYFVNADNDLDIYESPVNDLYLGDNYTNDNCALGICKSAVTAYHPVSKWYRENVEAYRKAAPFAGIAIHSAAAGGSVKYLTKGTVYMPLLTSTLFSRGDLVGYDTGSGTWTVDNNYPILEIMTPYVGRIIESGTVVKKSVDEIEETLNGTRTYGSITTRQPVASFISEESGLPLSSFKFAIEPVQDLHGQDNPWPAGGGKNKFDYDTTYAVFKQSDGTFRGVASAVLSIHYRIPSGVVGSQLTFSAFLDLTNSGTLTWVRCRANVSGSWVNGNNILNGATGYSSVTFTPTSADDYVLLEYGSNGGNSYTFSDIQLEVSASRTTFSPYSNICPITGWTGAVVTRTGKNLANFINGKGIDTSGSISDATARIATVDVIKIDNTQSYCFSFVEDTDFRALYCVYSNGSMIRRTTGVRSGAVLNVQGGDSVRICIYDNNGSRQASVENQKPMLELGSTATAFEQYRGQTYSITFPSSAGTVYGGELNATTGVLTVTHGQVGMGSLSWIYTSTQNFFTVNIPTLILGNNPNMICSTYRAINGIGDSNMGSAPDKTINHTGVWVKVKDLSYTDSTTFKTAMSGQSLVYELATPVTYQLTPIEVTTLLGMNNVWANTGNILSFTYPKGLSGGMINAVNTLEDAVDIATVAETKSYLGIT